MEKILITGTGRCGTTFLIKLFTFLDFSTGFSKENYKKYIFENCNSGMEKSIEQNYYIIKNPLFINQIENIITNNNYIVKKVIIPVRDYRLAAQSRAKYDNRTGGFWNATDEQTQIDFFHKIMSEYLLHMVRYNIDTIFIDFDKMVSDKKYLFDKLKDILDEKNIDFETFSNVYDEVSLTSKPN